MQRAGVLTMEIARCRGGAPHLTPPSKAAVAWRNNAEQYGTGSERYHILLKLQGKCIKPIIMASQLFRSGSWALLLQRTSEEVLVTVASAS